MKSIMKISNRLVITLTIALLGLLFVGAQAYGSCAMRSSAWSWCKPA
jgi:hypothetical protein